LRPTSGGQVLQGMPDHLIDYGTYWHFTSLIRVSVEIEQVTELKNTLT
jgi:hypothetical protein